MVVVAPCAEAETAQRVGVIVKKEKYLKIHLKSTARQLKPGD